MARSRVHGVAAWSKLWEAVVLGNEVHRVREFHRRLGAWPGRRSLVRWPGRSCESNRIDHCGRPRAPNGGPTGALGRSRYAWIPSASAGVDAQLACWPIACVFAKRVTA